MYWRNIYICPECGRQGQRLREELAKSLLYCPGCRKLKSKKKFKKESRPSDEIEEPNNMKKEKVSQRDLLGHEVYI